ncbi:putative ATP-dependent RNA helicase TDRD12 isoform X2 [Nomia melanderi]|uniref:putative ATP-dependent RNA helicase TDRD12 isoform X2 n=1 Tax=Nomia melanderi TaxID=2448451 RepID=UPI003FCD2193
MKTEMINNEGNILPSTAISIKVTNILTPYIIRILKQKDYKKKLNLINKKLMLLEKKGMLNIDVERVEPKIGNVVIVHDKLDKDLDLPAWLCRGIINSILDDMKNIYNVFLPDYGIAVELQRNDFCMSSTDLILDEYLTYTVGLYDILPAALKYNSPAQGESSLLVSEEWNALAIQYIKDLMVASSTIYFDHLASDERGMMKFLQNLVKCEKLENDIINDEIILYNISKEYKKSEETNAQKESFIKRMNKFKGRKQLYDKVRKGKEKVLIYGKIKFECLQTISDLKFPAEIHKAWKSLIKSFSPKKLQSYILPAIKSGLDVIAIGAAQSGKTLGYTFAICGLLASKLDLPRGVNPVALILCSSSSKVLEVHSLFTEFLQRYKTIESVAAINGKSERSLVAEMFNGCQILISTPRFLTGFIDQNRKLLKFESLQYLILDDGDVILDKYFDSISKLFKKHKIIHNRELRNTNGTLQIIITAKHWTPQLKKMAAVLMDCPYMCIASFIEATIFKSVYPKMYIVNSKTKDRKLLDLLSNEFSKLRTVIICTNSAEAEKVHKFLKQSIKDILLAHEDMNLIHLQGIKQCWDACVSDSYPVLICTDEVLSDLDITNATWLIHYSISLRFKTQFNFRFSTLFDNLQEEKSTCKVTILVDENNDIQFLSIIEIMQRINVVIPQSLSENIEHIRTALEKKKDNYPLCNNIKLWGFCYKNHSCTLRHKIISELDAPIIDIRMKDKVKFRIISIHNVTQISARIISYIKFDTSEEIELSNVQYMEIIIKIQEFYSSVDNRRNCESIYVGCICGLEEPVDCYKRVQILHIDEEDEMDKPKYADVRCIDNGVILKKVNIYRLLHMPEELIKYPAQVVDVFLTDIAPHDDEYVWNRCAIDTVFQWFKDNVDGRSYVIGTVNLHLKNTIWVNTLEIGTKLIGYKDIVGSSLKTELIKNDHAVENPEHLQQMYQLCKDAGLLELNGYNLNVLMNK